MTLFFAGAAALPGKAGPTGQAVRRELQHILNTDLRFRTDWFDWARLNRDWVNRIADLVRNPLSILLVLLVGLGLYYLLHRLTPYLQRTAGVDRVDVNYAGSSETMESHGFNACYQEALRYAAAAEYRAAVIALHQATVAYLFTYVFPATTGKTYTNNDLKRKLAGNHLLDRPFAIITTYAEIAGFSANAINPADFAQALAVFEKYFLANRRGRL